MNNIRVRFAPSPTGYLHIGGMRTALYNYLFARKMDGACILRIEDTDQNREVEGAAENLVKVLHELGIDFSESPIIGGKHAPYTQSERLELYTEHAQRLLNENKAYHCFCSPETLDQMRDEQQAKGEAMKYDRRCMSLSKEDVQSKLDAGTEHVIRLRMPDDRKFVFEDIVRGEVEIDADQSDDQVLIKSDGFPTYHLAAVVDDHYMEISHVIRGDEWLSSTPKHVWLYECFGWEAPKWVHLPLILNTDRSKLSKRMNDVAVESYFERGFLKEALINFVALLGWHAADDREFYSMDELCEAFSFERVSKSGAVFDQTKLIWMNGQYMRSLPLEEIAERAKRWFNEEDTKDESRYLKMVEAARQRCSLLPEIAEYAANFLSRTPLDEENQEMISSEDAKKVLEDMHNRIVDIDISDADSINQMTKDSIAATGIKGRHFYTPLRLALISQPQGPDLPTTLQIIGKDEALARMKRYF
ncbi:MAG TPA: glutamate--tRNA ligase [Candidatus Cloacimonetes bacterium]|nr:glutamate--tRNA ligase [Candidatus Cloacimonadota bacterium]